MEFIHLLTGNVNIINEENSVEVVAFVLEIRGKRRSEGSGVGEAGGILPADIDF